MAETDTIESFVSKLKSEGVEQGRREAAQLRGEAERQAAQIIADAKSQAEKILADARLEAEKIVNRGRTELELAARDSILKLREALVKTLEAALVSPVEAQLKDTEFLKGLIQSAVLRYVEADIQGISSVKLNISPEMNKELVDWALGKLRGAVGGRVGNVDMKQSLRQAGFEVNVRGATVEVTTESVVETLMELVGPGLREALSRAVQKREGK